MDAIYARQSVSKKDSLSIEGQIELCRKHAKDDAQIYCDRGFSAKNINRPALTQLIEDVESGRIAKIYTYRLDRLSRSILDFSRLWELLERCKVAFQSVTENFDTSTPMGRAMLNIVMTFAQLERETTAERVRDNYVHRFSHGAWPGGPAPFGFVLDKVTDALGNRASTLKIHNDNAEIVKQIFEKYSEFKTSLRSIAGELTLLGIHGPKRESWDNVTLSRILRNPVYVKADKDIFWYYLSLGLNIQNDIEEFDGEHACNIIRQRDRTKNKYNSLDGQKLAVSYHNGFIDSTLWLKVQEKLSHNRQIPLQNAGKYSWLTGILKCADCGYAIKINNNKNDGKLYLLCSGKSNLKICDSKIELNIKVLENRIADSIIKLLNECTDEQLYEYNAEQAEELLETEQKIDRLVNALSKSSNISATYISKEIEKLHQMREQLSTPKNSVKTIPKIDFANAEFEDKRIIAAQFIEKILVKEDYAEVIWKL